MSKKEEPGTKTVKIRGVLVKCYTTPGLAKAFGKSHRTIQRYVGEDDLLPAPFYLGSFRLYPEELVEALKPLVKKIPRGIECPLHIRTEIRKLIIKEKEKYASKK